MLSPLKSYLLGFQTILHFNSKDYSASLTMPTLLGESLIDFSLIIKFLFCFVFIRVEVEETMAIDIEGTVT